MCFPRFRPGCHDLIGSFPARRALEPAQGPAAVIPALGERRLAVSSQRDTEKAEGPVIT